MEQKLKRVLAAVILVFFAVFSVVFIGDRASSPETHAKTIASIDNKAETVLKFTTYSTLASAIITVLPDDTATPIAEKLSDFTEDFLLILCVLYAEKYLLTIIGAGAFKVLIPIACACFAVGLFWKGETLKKLAIKFAVFGLAIFVTIPLSIGVSDMIYDSYSGTIDETIAAAESFTGAGEQEAQTEEQGTGFLSNAVKSAAQLRTEAPKLLRGYVEALAVMIVTSCIIPVLVLVFFVWLIKMVTGIELNLPGRRRRGGPGKKVGNVAEAAK